MRNSKILSIVLVLVFTMLYNLNAMAVSTLGYTYPDVYIQDKFVDFESCKVAYFDNELCMPVRETFKLLGAEVLNSSEGENNGTEQGSPNDVWTAYFHNLDIQFSMSDGSISYKLNGEDKKIDDCVRCLGNYMYVKLSAMENFVDVNYDNLEKHNKISLRDYTPQTVEYKNKQWSKGSANPVDIKGKGEVLFYTENGLEVRKVRKYILWFIPWGYNLYVQDISGDKYIKYVK